MEQVLIKFIENGNYWIAFWVILINIAFIPVIKWFVNTWTAKNKQIIDLETSIRKQSRDAEGKHLQHQIDNLKFSHCGMNESLAKLNEKLDRLIEKLL